jgi:hypothetical protein
MRRCGVSGASQRALSVKSGEAPARAAGDQALRGALCPKDRRLVPIDAHDRPEDEHAHAQRHATDPELRRMARSGATARSRQR